MYKKGGFLKLKNKKKNLLRFEIKYFRRKTLWRFFYFL